MTVGVEFDICLQASFPDFDGVTDSVIVGLERRLLSEGQSTIPQPKH